MCMLTDNVPRRDTVGPDYEPDYEGSTHTQREAEAGCDNPRTHNTGFSREGANNAFSQEVSERANIAHS